MIILDINNKPLIIDSIYVPTATDSMWVLDLNMMDFTLAPLTILEEIQAPSLELLVHGFKFVVPAYWHILIVDPDTAQLDVVPISELPGRKFSAFLFGVTQPNFESAAITVVNYYPNYVNVSPSLHRHQMLCHPISPEFWINISPHDGYGKYLKDSTAGDLI